MPRIKLSLLPLLLLTAVLLTLPVQAAGARTSFYSEHAGECVQDGRLYALNGAPGYVTVFRSPQDGQIIDYLLNEGLLTVDCTWQGAGGEVWGLLRYESLGRGRFVQNGTEDGGWVRMSEMGLQYSRDLFVAEHLDGFVYEETTLDMRLYDAVYLWPYPGSGGRPELATWYTRTEADNLLTFPAYWVDSLGRRWGGYSFFDADGFICLDEPGLETNVLPEIDVNYFTYPAADSSVLPRIPSAVAASSYTMAAVGGALLLAVAVTALLWRRRRKRIAAQDLSARNEGVRWSDAPPEENP